MPSQTSVTPLAILLLAMEASAGTIRGARNLQGTSSFGLTIQLAPTTVPPEPEPEEDKTSSLPFIGILLILLILSCLLIGVWYTKKKRRQQETTKTTTITMAEDPTMDMSHSSMDSSLGSSVRSTDYLMRRSDSHASFSSHASYNSRSDLLHRSGSSLSLGEADGAWPEEPALPVFDVRLD